LAWFVPTGYSFISPAAHLFTLCVIFIAQATNTALPLDRQIVILLIAMLMSGSDRLYRRGLRRARRHPVGDA